MMFPMLAWYIRERFPKILELPPRADGSYDQVHVMRNKALRDIVLGVAKNVEWFAFLDNDLLPDERLDPLWTAPGDIVGAKYVLQNPNSFADPNVVHGGAMRFHRKVVEAMKPPYFNYIYNNDVTELVGCECIGFCRQAVELGFKINRAGFSDHKNLRSYC